MDQIPPAPEGTPTGTALVYRNITTIVDVWRGTDTAASKKAA